MRIMRLAAMAVALIAGSMALPAGPASAAPVGAGALPLATAASNPLVEPAQYYYVRRRYRPYRYYRPYVYRRPIYRPYYGYYRPRVYRPRVACAVRYTAWGPRRVCWRRW